MIAQLGELPEGFEEMGMPVKMTGWGSDSALTSFSPVMKEHTLNLETIKVCDAMLDEDIDESFVCSAGDFGSTVCFGDSGGPLQIINRHNVTARPIIVGVVNFGVPCGLGRPDAFARISHYKDWINEELQKLESATYPTSSDRALASVNDDYWTSPSLESFMVNDLATLYEGQLIQCHGDHASHPGYRYIFGERYQVKAKVSVSRTIDCTAIAPLGTLLGWCRYGNLSKIEAFSQEYPDVDLEAQISSNYSMSARSSLGYQASCFKEAVACTYRRSRDN